MITKHPLQAFSRQYFRGQTEFPSFSKVDYETAVALGEDKQETQNWWQGQLQADKAEVIELADLFSFFRHPQQYFIQHQLGIRYTDRMAEVEEREPFEIDNLEAYDINQQWIECQLNNQSFSLKKLQAQGRWLSGINGEIAFSQQELAIDDFVSQIKQLGVGLKKQHQPIDLTMGEYRLIGNLEHIYEQGSLFYRYANLKGKDFMLAWIHHLIINQIKPQQSYLLSKDESVVFSPKTKQEDLMMLINIYHQGQQQPDAFFTESAFSYVKHALKLKNKSKSKKPALEVAQQSLIKETGFNQSLKQFYPSEEYVVDLLNESFKLQCEDFILPQWERC